MEKIFVVGAGTMGNGIAQTAAVSGYKVTMMDVDASQLEKARETIQKSVEKLFQKERITIEAKEEALAIETTSRRLACTMAFLTETAWSYNVSIWSMMEAFGRSVSSFSRNRFALNLKKLNCRNRCRSCSRVNSGTSYSEAR